MIWNARFSGVFGQTVVKARRERWQAILSFRTGAELSLEELGKVLGSPEEALCEGLSRIMQFPRMGGQRSPEQVAALEKSFGDTNRIAEAPFVASGNDVGCHCDVSSRWQEGAAERRYDDVIETVAHLLPYCDAMFMDNECRSLLLNIPLALRPPEASRVYSLNSRTEFP